MLATFHAAMNLLPSPFPSGLVPSIEDFEFFSNEKQLLIFREENPYEELWEADLVGRSQRGTSTSGALLADFEGRSEAIFKRLGEK